MTICIIKAQICRSKPGSVQKDFFNTNYIFQVVPMLGMVVTVFILCWAPILIFEVLQSYDIIGTQVFGSTKHTKTCFSLLAYFNRWKIKTIYSFSILICFSCINPLIYGFMSRNFRQSFSDALCQCKIGQTEKHNGSGSKTEKR